MDSYQERLHTLYEQRHAIERQWSARYEEIEALNQRARENNSAQRRQEVSTIDAQINALYLLITEGRGLQDGDVLVALQKYGDLKAGEHGFFEKEWIETERTKDLWVTLRVDGGSISVPKTCVALELNADAADKFRLSMALRHLQWTQGKPLLPLLLEAQGILTDWIARLKGGEDV
jgi:hypothetical protein